MEWLEWIAQAFGWLEVEEERKEEGSWGKVQSYPCGFTRGAVVPTWYHFPEIYSRGFVRKQIYPSTQFPGKNRLTRHHSLTWPQLCPTKSTWHDRWVMTWRRGKLKNKARFDQNQPRFIPLSSHLFTSSERGDWEPELRPSPSIAPTTGRSSLHHGITEIRPIKEQPPRLTTISSHPPPAAPLKPAPSRRHHQITTTSSSSLEPNQRRQTKLVLDLT